ncbi:MAG: tetratricopeptide repeat protein [Spirulina sp. SIO3F2]|nr:tetratricopeptide repeat protein [Spirulina sp. SIO3F2]
MTEFGTTVRSDTAFATFEQENPEAITAFTDLLRALRRKRGFGLFFVQCSHLQGQQAIAVIQEQFPQKRVIEFILTPESETLYDTLATRYRAEEFDLVCITGVEESLYKYEETLRQAGWESEAIFNYQWKDTPPLMSHLNRQRETFAEHLPILLVFFVPNFVIDYFIRRAPDFFDWRSGWFEFMASETAFQASIFDALVYYNKADMVLTRAESERAIVEIKAKILQLDDRRYREKSKLLREQGRAFNAIGYISQALDCYDLALQTDPENERAWLSKGRLLYDLAQYQEALNQYDRAVHLNSELPEVWYGRGLTLEALEKYPQAIESYRATLTIDPRHMDCWHRKGKLLIKAKNYTQAIRTFEKALTFDPESENFWYLKGILHHKLKQYEDALVSIEKALDLNSLHTAYWYHYGMLLKDLQQYAAAIESFDQVLAIKPYDDQAWCMRGIVMELMGEHEQARNNIQRSLVINPRNFQAWEALLEVEGLETMLGQFVSQ